MECKSPSDPGHWKARLFGLCILSESYIGNWRTSACSRAAKIVELLSNTASSTNGVEPKYYASLGNIGGYYTDPELLLCARPFQRNENLSELSKRWL